ncbi:GYF domain protein [Opisthorchis viverrini]|uniref:GYF domain protein n=1 Tax=Opisthorchis viverrini TaxID=6198 RepID=A0A1S8WKB6_OPIVI|nr:GYF domain protein [Opisthorchis viverrini]
MKECGGAHWPSIVIPIRIPRGTRKKSQSTDTEGNNLPGGSPEDLNVEEVDSSWQRPARQPWHHNNNASNSNQSQHPQSSYFSSHSRQRYPSGPHTDISQTTANISLRAAPPSDNRRGGHGDWSRGCAGWRQRSYSGSERSELVSGTNFRGRGTGGGHFGLDGDETTTRSRGRGRAGGRYALQHRGGPGSRGYHPSHGGHRPISFIGPVNSCDATEEFWQDEDWDSVGLDGASNFDFPSKPRERLNSKASVEGLPANVAANESSSVGSGPNAVVPTHTRDLNKARVHSKSCSAEPPPGFDASSQHTTNRNPHPSETPVSVSSQSTMGDTQAPNPPLHDAASSRWYYIDSVGRTQGPFIRQQMSAWLTGGYLPLTIEVRRDCDECFLTLGEHINLTGRVPFSDGYPLPPLKRSNLPALVAASKKPAPNPRWINTVAPPNPQPADFVVGPPPFSPSVNNVMAAATAAAAPALALFFATAASLTTSASPQPLQTQPQSQQPQSPSVQSNIKSMPSVVDSPKPSPLPSSKVDSYPSPVIGGNPEILRLYTEAQALAVHAAKVEAERQELADKLAAINSTAAKLLAASPGLSMATTEMVDSDPCSKTTSSDCAKATHEVREYGSTSVHMATAQELTSSTPPVASTGLGIEQERHLAQTRTEEQHPQEAIADRRDEDAAKVEDNLTGVVSAKPNQQQATFTDQTPETGVSKQLASDADVTGKKAKKKNKKSKKKITPEQERQMAWDAEFERRKAAALERKLAEEAELQRIANEEAAAAAAEEQAQMKEQLRLAAEQRKREVARAKASSQLGQLRLPKTSCWGGSATTTAPGDPGDAHASSSLLAIQAAQAMEEAERKRHDALLAEQAALLAEAEAAHQKTQQAWASVVNTTAKGTAKQVPMMKSPLSKSEFPAVKGASQNERTKSSQNGNTSVVPGLNSKASAVTASTGTTKAAVSGTSTSSSAVAGPSIWDLPGNGKTESATSSGKNSKKHNKKKVQHSRFGYMPAIFLTLWLFTSSVFQKNTRVNREAASYAAKEQLAHWCESQLSSMPLSGVDLPTLVDLLCELEAAEQVTSCGSIPVPVSTALVPVVTEDVVEFIETSLGRSKQISQFSKAFLEKRACVLNVP